MTATAHALGLARASSYQRYEDDKLYKGAILPFELVEKLLPLLFGKGEPPITAEEIYLLAGLRLNRDGKFESIDPKFTIGPLAHKYLAQKFLLEFDSHVRLEKAADHVLRKAVNAPLPLDWPRDIPVRSASVDTEPGGFEFGPEVVEYARRLPGISDPRSVIALYMPDQTMSPWRKLGDVVYASLTREARPGDHVVVEMNRRDKHPEEIRGIVAKLVSRGGPNIVLEQYNPPIQDLQFPAALVRRILRVLEWEELIGV